MIRIASCAVLLAAAASFAPAAFAAKGEPVTDCVDLGSDARLSRKNAQHLYVRDGADHYRVSFRGGECGAMALTSQLRLESGGTDNRLCPKEGRLHANGRRCNVSTVERIDGEEFARATRKR